jgi:hypothetical protein
MDDQARYFKLPYREQNRYSSMLARILSRQPSLQLLLPRLVTIVVAFFHGDNLLQGSAWHVSPETLVRIFLSFRKVFRKRTSFSNGGLAPITFGALSCLRSVSSLSTVGFVPTIDRTLKTMLIVTHLQYNVESGDPRSCHDSTQS